MLNREHYTIPFTVAQLINELQKHKPTALVYFDASAVGLNGINAISVDKIEDVETKEILADAVILSVE